MFARYSTTVKFSTKTIRQWAKRDTICERFSKPDGLTCGLLLVVVVEQRTQSLFPFPQQQRLLNRIVSHELLCFLFFFLKQKSKKWQC
jgi:hypothetical protein